MKRKIFSILFALVLVLILLAMPANVWAYSGGSGTEGDPYQIASTDDLIGLSKSSGNWGAYFIQTADITFNSDETQEDWDGDGNPDGSGTSGFSPIGNSTTKFTGSYDGDGYTIDNLYIDRSTDYIGLFGYINDATLTDLHVLNVDMTGNQYCGIVVGGAEGTSTISSSYSSGSITASCSVAGLIGLINATGVSINNCHTQVNVTSTSEVSAEASGFIGTTPTTPGEEFNPSITNSSSSGTVTAQGRNAGGFVGYFNGGTIEKCFSSVNIDATTSGQGNAGGFIGGMNAKVSSSSINDCYAVGNVSGGSNNSSEKEWHNGVGGFVGTIRQDYTPYTKNLSRCYSSGAVTQTESGSDIGGFIGRIATGGSATVTNCFWDTQTSGQSRSAGDYAAGKTTFEMQTKSTFLDVAWDIVLIGDYGGETWYINENNDYPRLGWEYATPTVTTTAVSSITATTAESGGNVTDSGGATVTARGVCWSTTENPTTADGHTTDGTGTGEFTSSITGLSSGTTYYVRAYATNSVGTGYGEQKEFTAYASAVPTLSWWGTMVMIVLFGGLLAFILRRKLITSSKV